MVMVFRTARILRAHGRTWRSALRIYFADRAAL